MCGIAGAWLRHADPRFPISPMLDTLKHRGPDDEGYVLVQPQSGGAVERAGADTAAGLALASIEAPWPDETRVLLGHRRLSIIDLSVAGHQPMTDTEARLWMTYNGEIYNYRELRDELTARGARFRSGTDTEVILEAYKHWGAECFHRFNGMWALALWDATTRQLVCARDRYGVKPLYYAVDRHGVYFASEIKALLTIPTVKRAVNEAAVFDYLALSLPQRGSQTFFQGIYALEAGSLLRLDAAGQVTVTRWYTLPDVQDRLPYTPQNAQQAAEYFQDAVRLRLRSDVPVGSCLSGGLDSSSIVALAARAVQLPMHTFSSCFDDPRFDERRFIRLMVQQTGVQSHLIFPHGEAFWHEWPALVYQQEEPFNSTSIYAQWCVMRQARECRIPVLLDGQGADELLGGYLRYRINRAATLLGQGTLTSLPLAWRHPRSFGVWGFRRLSTGLQRLLSRGVHRYARWLQADFAKRYTDRRTAYVVERGVLQGSLHEALRSDFLAFSLPALLRYEDKNSMRFSIETRLPFLDYRFVEWVFRLDEAAKIDRQLTKRVLRDSMRGLLPEAVRLRADKMGFVTPGHHWLQQGLPYLHDLFSTKNAPGLAHYLQTDKVLQALRQGQNGEEFLWRCVNLAMWLQVFFAGQDLHKP